MEVVYNIPIGSKGALFHAALNFCFKKDRFIAFTGVLYENHESKSKDVCATSSTKRIRVFFPQHMYSLCVVLFDRGKV